MLTYMALEEDHPSYRSAKLKALQAYFTSSPPQSFAKLSSNAMSPSNNERGMDLILYSHTNGFLFGGYDPATLLSQLHSKGFHSGSFKRIFLIASNDGQANEENSRITKFARALKRELIMAGIDSRLHTTRGAVTYEIMEKTKHGHKIPVVIRTFIKAPEGEYPLQQGMLLIQ